MYNTNNLSNINGLFYFSDFISENEEKELISNIDSSPWCLDLVRRTQHYGFKYDYRKRKIDESMKLGEIPSFLSSVTNLVGNFFKELPDQVIVNEYQVGQNISPHIDCVPCFGPVIASLSLQSPNVMRFKSKTGERNSIILKPRSLLLLENEARYDWLHSLGKQKEVRRLSITFRKVIL